ncbi:acyl-CoA binding domain-containing protein 6 [Mortierella alpina]|nr:acyl-CoA binding domain-containing protein 6 [Mortierella alpina]
MSTLLEARFNSASAYMAASKKLSLPSSTKLALYADFKLATEGLCSQPRPSLIEFEKSAKWKAWKEAGEKYTKDLNATTTITTADQNDSLQLTLSTMAMVSYVQRVEDGQWGWTFDPASFTNPTDIASTGDHDLDELNAYLGEDKDEISAEELLARPYVPTPDQMEGGSMTASGISTMVAPEEDELGEDPLKSAKNGSIESLREAVVSDPSVVTLKDDMGMTLLHWACDRGALDKVKLLAGTANTDVNAQDAEGLTPLHYAYLSGWPVVVEYLKSLPNVDQTIKDNTGMVGEEYLE